MIKSFSLGEVFHRRGFVADGYADKSPNVNFAISD